VPFGEAEALGHAAVELLRDEEEWTRCQQAALARVRTYYTEQVMIDAYRALYCEAKAV
jgi:glycosyltransferase involved in cell wall biosynthesis